MNTLFQEALEQHDRELSLNWQYKVARLSETLRRAVKVLEKARPSIKARAIELADGDQYDDLVGEIEQVLSNIEHLNLR